MITSLLRRPVTWAVLAALGAGAAFGLYWFQPWRLFTDKEVRETVPAVAASGRAAPAGGVPATGTPSSAPGDRVLAAGTFIAHEHATSGQARLVRLADGRRQLVLIGLETSDGPDLRVWLSDQDVVPGSAGWRVFDDGEWLELGRLKGNKGDQVYDVPAGADLAGLDSVTIWCRRFSVSFGAAALTAV